MTNEAREFANQAARAENVTVGAWLSTIIEKSRGTARPRSEAVETLETVKRLKAIERRLVRIEKVLKEPLGSIEAVYDAELDDLLRAYAKVSQR